MQIKEVAFSFFIIFTAPQFWSQNPTLNKTGKDNTEARAAHKVLIIPFEPRLYMGEIDRQINLETNLSAKEIRFKFRDGLNDQIYKAFRSAKFGALDLMEDTLKYKKDLTDIYQYLSYDYLKVPDQKNYKPPVREKESKKVEKGQLNVETNSDARFMNARITNPKVMSALSTKYRSDLFIFINQLDIKASGSKDPLYLGPESENRRITVHYTIINSQGKEINSGLVEEEFDPSLNNPKKIVDKHFSRIALTLVERVNKQLSIPSK